jgi:hypothetical protein
MREDTERMRGESGRPGSDTAAAQRAFARRLRRALERISAEVKELEESPPEPQAEMACKLAELRGRLDALAAQLGPLCAEDGPTADGG